MRTFYCTIDSEGLVSLSVTMLLLDQLGLWLPCIVKTNQDVRVPSCTMSPSSTLISQSIAPALTVWIQGAEINLMNV